MNKIATMLLVLWLVGCTHPADKSDAGAEPAVDSGMACSGLCPSCCKARWVSDGLESTMQILAYESKRRRVLLVERETSWEWDDVNLTKADSSGPPGAWPGLVYDPVRDRAVRFGGYRVMPLTSIGGTWEWDGARWFEQATAQAPTPRHRPNMVYDVSRKRVVLFGGHAYPADGGHVEEPLNDTWEWDGVSWVERRPQTSPPASLYPSMAYDEARASTVLFTTGGTWSWDGVEWATLSTASVGIAAACAYDRERQKTVIFGGVNGAQFSNATFTWNGFDFHQELPVNSPSARTYSAAYYDESERAVVMVGGALTPLDRWKWTGSNWEPLSFQVAPELGTGMSMAYDIARKEAVLFGGTDRKQRLVSGTWTWRDTRWVKHMADVTPEPRTWAAMTYDPVREQVLLFGGVGQSALLNDTWVWDGASWTKRDPAHRPSPRASPISFDSARGRAVLAGDDTWEWDGFDWLERHPLHAPSSEGAYASAYDPVRRVTVLVSRCSETWEWDGEDWALKPAASPQSTAPCFDRYGYAMAYDPSRRVVTYSSLVDTEVSDWDGVSWQHNRVPYFAGAGPEWNSHSMVWNEQTHRLMLFNGVTLHELIR